MSASEPSGDSTAVLGGHRLEGWALLVWPAVLVLLLYLVFIGGGWAGIYSVWLRIGSAVLGGAAVLVWLAVALFRADWRPSTVIWPAFLGSLGVFALGTALAQQPRLAFDYLAYAVLLTALYMLLVALLRHPVFRSRLEGSVVILAFGVSAVYLIVVVGHWIEWWGAVGRLTIPPLRPAFEGLLYGNPSAVATMSILLTASSVALLGVASRRRRTLSAVLVVLATATVIVSGSRGAWLGIGAAAVITGVAWLISRPRRDINPSLITRRAAVAAGALAVASLGVASVVGPTILRRIMLGGGEELRTTLNMTAIRMFAEAPAIGLGPGAWVDGRISHTRGTEVDYYIPHAHNLYTQTAAEFGVAGIAAGVLVALVLVWLVRRAIRSQDQRRRAVGWATLFSLVYIAAHQLVDFYPNMPAVLFALAFPVAWLDAAEHERKRPPGRFPGLVVVALMACTACLATGWLLWSERNAVAAVEGVEAANEGEWAQAHESFRVAVDDPGLPPYGFELGLAATFAGDFEEAATRLTAAASSMDLPQAWLDLAWVNVRRGNTEDARASLRQAMRLGWQQTIVSLGVGALYQELGDDDGAVDAYVQAILRTPSLAGDPAWRRNEPYVRVWPEVYATVLRVADPMVGYEAALVAGDSARASQIAASLHPPARETAELVIRAWGGESQAIHALEAAAARTPLDTYVVEWLARLASRAGDDPEAERYRTWGEIVTPFFGGTEVRIATAPVAGELVAGSAARYFGHYTYRRPTPWDLLAPGLPRLVLQ